MAAVLVSSGSVRSKRGWRVGAGWLALLVILCAVFPPFHVRTVPETHEVSDAIEPASSAQESAKRIWEQMLAARSDAVDVEALLEGLERNPAETERRYGRRIGYGGPAFYFVRGVGRVAQATRKAVMLEIEDQSVPAALVMGPVFGNALRDSTAFADMRDFDSFQFNTLSTELNLLSERRVQPRIAELSEPGTALRFIGAAKVVRRDSTALLEIVAVDIERAE